MREPYENNGDKLFRVFEPDSSKGFFISLVMTLVGPNPETAAQAEKAY
ncbi:MAG: hypothetical protein HUJ51_06235 [Eggerthellaceae bacterium]|nr:hypothetical protein [Eggerthellaceae bacterium]